MKRIKTLNTRNLCQSAKNGGCGECQTSCQSACKTSCGVANQSCENQATKAKKNCQVPEYAVRTGGIFLAVCTGKENVKRTLKCYTSIN